MPSAESFEYTIGYMEVQYQKALAEFRQHTAAADAWKKTSARINAQLNELFKQYTQTTFNESVADHVIINVRDY